jgi:hypothetical protein
VGQYFLFICGVNGIDYTPLLASVEISENEWFNGVFRFIRHIRVICG